MQSFSWQTGSVNAGSHLSSSRGAPAALSVNSREIGAVRIETALALKSCALPV